MPSQMSFTIPVSLPLSEPSERPTPAPPAWTALAARFLRGAGLLGLCAYGAHSVAGLGGAGLDTFFEDWVFNGLLFTGSALCLLRALACPLERAAWSVLGAGIGCWALGETLYTLDPNQLNAGFPATADYLWLVYYPAALVTIGLLVRARVRHFYASLWLDGLVGALAVGALACEFILPAIVAGTGSSLESVVADLIYPLGDLLLLAFVIAVLALTGWRPGRVLGTVAAGLALGSIADGLSLYWSATGHTGSTVFDSLWPASALTLGWAAWPPAAPRAVVQLHGRRLLVFPVAFAASALGLLALEHVRPLHGATYTLAVLTLAGAIARMGLTFSENVRLVEASMHEAQTDQLTGLGNRRSLMRALEDALSSASPRHPWMLALLDLNGFKRYNDTFGHPVGDALLARLGAKLAAAVAPEGCAYRLGGDEFCVLSRLDRRSPDAIAAAAVAALSERGKGFAISTARGYVRLPEEAQAGREALALADERLYADKRSRTARSTRAGSDHGLHGAGSERVLHGSMPNGGLHGAAHLEEVAAMVRLVGVQMGMDEPAIELTVRAAELNDVGKVAVPDEILDKRTPLDPEERAIVERHSEVGERILAGDPTSRDVARLVRASRERFDGKGYPDRLAGAQIPLGARVIAVCDAFRALTTDRPYCPGVQAPDAITELRRCAGSQFDPDVVRAFCEVQRDALQSEGRAAVRTQETEAA